MSECQCGRPVADAYVCSTCWLERDDALSDMPELVADLWDAIGRQTNTGARVGGPGAERPLPVNRNLGTLMGSLRHELVTWVLTLLEDAGEPVHGPVCTRCLHPSCQRIRGNRHPEDSITDMARWLLAHSERARHHVDAPLMFDGITSLVAYIRRSLDRPGIARYLPCPSAEPCHGRIRVTADTIHARCDTCGWETTDLLWLGRMLRGDEPVIVTAVEACHLLIADGIDIVPATLRKWVERGKISTRNPQGPTCTWCDHETCDQIRGRIHNWYDIEEVRRVSDVDTVRAS